MNEILEMFMWKTKMLSVSPPIYASFLVFSVKSLFLLYITFLFIGSMYYIYIYIYVIVHIMEACNKDYFVIITVALDNLSSLRQIVNIICIFRNEIINCKWYVEMEFNVDISHGSVQATVMRRLRYRTPVSKRFDGMCQQNKSTLILKNLSPRAA